MDWHRLFGLILTDFFSGSPFTVELEKDLSLKQQFLDVVILRRGPGDFHGRLPDGLENLAAHNLISFKSHQEALDDWALKELIGHYVNYRKQVSPSMQRLLPEEEFRLYMVSARYPHNLAGQVTLEELQPGVYQCRWGTDVIRVVVLRHLPQVVHNALWFFFSAVPEQVGYAAQHYRQRSETSTLIYQLFEGYQREGVAMSYTMEDFRRDFTREHLGLLTSKERLEGLPAKERLEGLPAKERLEGLSAEEIAKNVPVEQILKNVPIEQILKNLPPEAIKNYVRRLENGSSNPPE